MEKLGFDFSFRVVALILLQLGVFLMDLFLPSNAVTIVAYIAVVQFTLWLPKSQHTLYASIASTILIVLASFWEQSDESLFSLLINRGVALSAIWVTALFVLRYERAVLKIGESESFNVLFKAAGEGLIIVNKWGNIINVNPESAKIFGYSETELEGRNLETLIPERFLKEYKSFKKRFYQNPEVIHIGEAPREETLYGLRKDKEEFPVEVGVGFYKTVDEILTVIFVADITERREVEKQIAESKEWLSNFMNSTPAYISIIDNQLRIVDCNTRMLEVFNATSKEDVIGKYLAELYPNIKEGEDLEKYKKVLTTGENLTFDKEVEHPLFGQKYFRFSLFKAGSGLGSIIEDFTNEKLIEKKISESKERLSNFIDSTNQYITILDKNLNITDCNKPILKMFNVDDKKEVIGKPLVDFSPEIETNGRLELYKKVIKTGERVEYEQEINHPLLGHKYFFISLFKANNGIGSIIEDVTERKVAEERLRKSEERYALAQRAANIGSWDWDIPSGNLEWSDTIESIFGFEKGKFGKTYEAFIDCIHSEDRQFVIDSVDASLNEGKDYNIEHRIVWPDNTVHWLSETGDVMRDEQGKAVRMLGIVMDITERKEMEETLQKVQEKNNNTPGLVL